MKKVVIGKQYETVILNKLPKNTPIFASKDGEICGIVAENEEGWLLMLGGDNTAFSNFNTRVKLLTHAVQHGYTFFVM